MLRKFTQMKFLLLLFMATTLVTSGISAAVTSNNNLPGGNPWASKYSSDAEAVNMRSQNMKHFRNPQGNFTAFVSTGSIHYKFGNNWLEINNQIVTNTSSRFASKKFANTTNNFKTYYPSNPFTETVLVEYAGNVFEERISKVVFVNEQNNIISYLPISEKIIGKPLGNQMVYANVYPGVDLVYTQNNDGKKMDLVINSNSFLSVIPAGASKIAIIEEVTLPNGIKVETTNSGIELSQNNKLLVNYPNPIAFETESKTKQYGTDNDIMLEGSITSNLSGKVLTITTSFDVNWLKNANRNFPVKLDPTANYGVFSVAMATGRMTASSGAKQSGFLRLAATNSSFTWAKFNIAGLASTGIVDVDSARYWGYHYTGNITTDKFSKVVGMSNVDPVADLNTAIETQINTGPIYNNNYIFGGSPVQWRTAMLDTTLTDTALLSSVSRGWFALGMTTLSGNTGFMYHYGFDGTANLNCYIEVTYQTAPCVNPVMAGTVIGDTLVCGGSVSNLSLSGATVGTGVTYQWQSSPDSLIWSNVIGAQSPAFSPIINTDSIYYRCEVICNLGTPAFTNAFKVKADVFVVTSLNAYEEGFESITANNQLPACMVATNIGNVTYTYTAAQANTFNQVPRTGNKFGSFRYFCNDFFFTKGLKLTQGVTYSFSTWFITDGFTGSWDSVALYVATAPNASAATLLPGTTLIQPSNIVYQKLTGSFTPTTSGVYRFAFKVVDAGNPWYLSIDDIKVEVAQAPLVNTTTKANITTTGATLSGNITADGGAAVSVSGVVVSTSPLPVRGGFGVIDSSSNPNIGMGAFSVNVAGLNLGTTYYYRAYATNAIGTTYGADSTFTTNTASVIPTVVRTTPTNLLAYSATVGGNITSNGGDPVFASGVVYSTMPNPALFGFGVIDSANNPVVTLGTFASPLGGLTHSTKYYYRAYATNAVGTAYSVQDSFTTTPVVSNLPYNQNFDSTGNTGWSSAIVTGTPNDWIVGTPAKTILSGAFTAPNAWVTKLSGNYATSHDAALVSPQFDFSTLTGNPILRFKHKFNTESCCDGGVLEISINGGAWTKVENTVGTGGNFNTTNATAWYNGAAQGNTWNNLSSAYSTAVNGWITSSIALPGAAAQSNVKIRFRFITDTSVEADGWAIDNIEVFAPSAPTVATGTKTNITTASVTLAGNITNDGGNTITASGVVISTSPAPVRGGFGVVDSATNPLVTGGAFTVNVGNLFAATTYYYRAYAVNAIGTSYGVDSSFTTNASAVVPTVVRTTPTNLLAYSATLGGNITSDGGSAVFASGVVYSTTPNPALFGFGVVDSTTNPAVTTGLFSVNPAGLTHSTKYYYRAYATNAVGTAYSVQDSFTTSPVVSNLPYNQNFDSTGNTGWSSSIVTGTPNDWIVGTPAKTILSGAFTAPNAWVTKLSGNYATSHDAALVSPQFDFSTLTGNPILRFKHKFNTESCCDGGVLEISINGGAWTKVENTVGTGGNFNTTNATAWYNGAAQGNTWNNLSSAYSTAVNGWITSSIALPGAAAQSNVKIRFRFITDTSVEADGWAIDNIEVFAPAAPTVATGTKTNITTASVTLAGNITNDGGNTITASGVVISTSPAPVRGGFGVVDSSTNPLVTGGAFTVNVAGLFTATTYYYRAYAVNAIGTSYGVDSSFTTNASAVVPTVLRTAASNIGTTAATVGGNITSDGGSAVFASGVVYSTTPNPALFGFGVVDSTTSPAVTTGLYSVSPAGLIHSTKYYYRAYATNAVGTAYSVQDSFVTSPIVNTLPYTQNFEGVTNTGWSSNIVGTGSNTWVLGTPAKTFLNGAYSGTKAWVTNLTGNYLGTENCAITSPQFDFTSFTATPILRFRHKMDIDNDPTWDGGVIEISINNGAWTALDNATGTGTNFNRPTAYAWYNDVSNNNLHTGSMFTNITTTYASHVNGWIESAVPLTGAATQSNVKVRFRFYADGFTDEGWAIDDIEVVNVVTPTTAASNVTATPSATSASVSFTAGNGTGRMVVARLTSVLAVAPTNNTMYGASAVYGSTNTTGTGNYIVYMGAGTSVNVTGLTAATGYTFDVYEYNGKYMHINFASGINSSTTTTPVKLLSFTAEKQNADVRLSWITASEKNNAGFNVERSIDGKTFEVVNFVKGTNNASRTNYVSTDKSAFALTGVNKLYYRLQQLDENGKFEYSTVVTVVNTEALTSEIAAYPNPFNDKLTVSISDAKAGVATIEVMDLSGRLMYAVDQTIDNGNQTITINELSNLSQGVYFVRISTSGNTKVVKMIKQ